MKNKPGFFFPKQNSVRKLCPGDRVHLSVKNRRVTLITFSSREGKVLDFRMSEETGLPFLPTSIRFLSPHFNDPLPLVLISAVTGLNFKLVEDEDVVKEHTYEFF